jgi:hypothetical protein
VEGFCRGGRDLSGRSGCARLRDKFLLRLLRLGVSDARPTIHVTRPTSRGGGIRHL